MNKTTLLIYGIIVLVAIVSSVLKKKKKAGGTNPTAYKKPAANTGNQPKSLEEILQSLLNEQKNQPKTIHKDEYKAPVTDKTDNKSYTPVTTAAYTETISSELLNDSELTYTDEYENYDETADHHVHGQGFDGAEVMGYVEEEENEWAQVDWRKSVIVAEILRRPEY